MPDKTNTIIIEVAGGIVQDVRNLPPGWTWELIDHDIEDDDDDPQLPESIADDGSIAI